MSTTFIPARLEMARAIRQMTATDLASAASISAPWISQIENVKKTPGPELVRELARVLNFPVEFFYRPVKSQPPSDAFHFRATSKLAKKDEATARSLSTLAIELSDWIEATYHSPAPAVPEVQDLIGSDDELSPEQAAEAVRGAWGLGVAPVKNLLQLLESKGAKVYSAARYRPSTPSRSVTGLRRSSSSTSTSPRSASGLIWHMSLAISSCTGDRSVSNPAKRRNRQPTTSPARF